MKTREETIKFWNDSIIYQIDTLQGGYADVTIFEEDKGLFLELLSESTEKDYYKNAFNKHKNFLRGLYRDAPPYIQQQIVDMLGEDLSSNPLKTE